MNSYLTEIQNVSTIPFRMESAVIQDPVNQSDINMVSNYWHSSGNVVFDWVMIHHNLRSNDGSFALHLAKSGGCTLQGLMTVALDGKCPKSIRKGIPNFQVIPKGYLYGCYLEVAPWNIRGVNNRLYKGVGEELVIFVLDYCENNNYNGMVLDSYSYNREFYNQFGFVDSGTNDPSRFVYEV